MESIGFIKLNDGACCAVSGGMASGDLGDEIAYVFGRALGIAARFLYDLGGKWLNKLKGPSVASATF